MFDYSPCRFMPILITNMCIGQMSIAVYTRTLMHVFNFRDQM